MLVGAECCLVHVSECSVSTAHPHPPFPPDPRVYFRGCVGVEQPASYPGVLGSVCGLSVFRHVMCDAQVLLVRRYVRVSSGYVLCASSGLPNLE